MNRGYAIASRRAAREPREARRKWVGLVEGARDFAQALAIGPSDGEHGATFAQRRECWPEADLIHAARDLQRDTFPSEFLAGSVLAEGMLRAILILRETFDAEVRAILVAQIGALATALDELLGIERCRRAERDRLRNPD